MKEVTILLYDVATTKFMQDADMFEPSKVALMHKVKATVVDDYGHKHVKALKERSKGAPYDVVAIYDDHKLYYRDPKIKILSDGHNFMMLDDLVCHLEPMEVEDAG